MQKYTSKLNKKCTSLRITITPLYLKVGRNPTWTVGGRRSGRGISPQG
jgi:hypothetical protein